MHRTALARTHRPRRFEELVGQDAVASTLRAATEGGRVAHAYLFCGPRGVGKTTAARLLAMALNCPEAEDGEPCGSCESCERIRSGRTNLDVVEIDAASHRGVDDARDLRERAMYAPTGEDRWKVYIVDEAHMLTRDAWNALLKILEEPPPRVIFAFATTEPQKIERSAAPVLSRCQRFDFRRVSVPDIVSRLEEVLRREDVEAEAGALRAIARRAEGGVRDALSLLDQVLSFTGDRVGTEDVSRMLGLVEEERYLAFLDIAARGARSAVFPFVRALLDEGHDPGEFVHGLADVLRILLVLRADPEGEALDVLPESRDAFLEMAGRFGEVDLLRLLMAVTDFESSPRFRGSAQQRIQLEVLLLRLVSMDSAVEMQELLAAVGGPPPPEAGRERASDASGTSVSGASGPGASAGSGTSPSGGSGASASGGSGRGGDAPSEDTGAGGEARSEGTGAPGGGPTELQVAWRTALASVPGLGGETVALRGARVEGLDEGRLRLSVHPGLLDDLRRFLEDRRRSAALREAVAERLGLDSDALAFDVGGGGPARRLTAEEARQQKLDQLLEVDPRLREAVEELDLTLEA